MSFPLPSREAFTAHYRKLTVNERSAFVADLKAVQGWQVIDKEGVVEARRDGVVRRFAVDEPKREIGVDVVVAADERLRSFAVERDVAILEPGELRDELLYRLERENGMKLLREHFGDTDWGAFECSQREHRVDNEGTNGSGEGISRNHKQVPETNETKPRMDDKPTVHSERKGRRHDTKPSKTNDPTTNTGSYLAKRYRIAAAALVLGVGVVLVFVALSGFGGVSPSGVFSDNEATVSTDELDSNETDTEIEILESSREDERGTDDRRESVSQVELNQMGSVSRTSNETRVLPPGISPSGGHDVEQLAETHSAEVKSYDSFRFRVRFEGPTGAEDVEQPADLDVRIAADNHFLIEEKDRGHREINTTTDVFADGIREYRRVDSPDGVRYHSDSIATDPTAAEWSAAYGADLIRTYLNTSESSVESRLDGQETVYQLVVDHPPDTLVTDADSYRASAIITSDGTVQRLTVTYQHRPTQESVWIQFRYDLERTTVDIPLWYERAIERTHAGSHPRA